MMCNVVTEMVGNTLTFIVTQREHTNTQSLYHQKSFGTLG